MHVLSVDGARHAQFLRITDLIRGHEVGTDREKPIERLAEQPLARAGLEFARAKPAKVTAYMREFSKPQYGVDVLKVEVPVNVRFVEGSAANTDGQVAYSRDEAKALFRAAAQVARVPFIYLSAGVTDEVFRETLELAAEAGTPFSGVLCGRATWHRIGMLLASKKPQPTPNRMRNAMATPSRPVCGE